jgi:hypothetical protein
MSSATVPIKLFTTEEASEMLGVRPQTLALWRSSRRQGPPYVKVGKHHVRYRVADLEAWLTAQTVPTPEA